MTDRYGKLTRTVPASKITASHVAVVAMENWMIPFGTPNTIMTDHGSQFVSKRFATLCSAVETKLIATTEYHPHANRPVERFIKTLVALLKHSFNQHQTNWDAYVQPLFYSYITKVHLVTNISSTTLVLSREPPGALVSGKTRTFVEHITTSQVLAKLKALKNPWLLIRRAEGALQEVRESYQTILQQEDATPFCTQDW